MKAHELLDSPAKWCQHAYARNKAGDVVFATSPSACSWCLTGALNLCYGPAGVRRLTQVKSRIERALDDRGIGFCIADWNDRPSTTFEKLRELLLELDV